MKSGRRVLFILGVVLMVGAGQISFGQEPPVQSYTNELGTLSLSYPADWTLQDRLVVTMTNDAALFDANQRVETLAAGQVLIHVSSVFDLNRPDVASTYEQMVDYMGLELRLFLRMRDRISMQPEPYLGQDAIQGRVSTEGFDIHALGIQVEPNVWVGISLSTAPGELEANTPIMAAIIESMHYTSPPPPVDQGTMVWQYQEIEEDFYAPISFAYFGPVAVSPSGLVYMRGSDYLYTFDETGTFQDEISLDTQEFADDIAIAADGTLWYVEELGDGDTPGWVKHVTADGFSIGSFDLDLDEEEAFSDRPQFIAVDTDGVAYAAFLIEEADETRIRVLSPEFAHLEREFTLEGVDEPIRDMKMSPDDLLYVLVDSKLRIHDLEGRLVEERSFVLPGAARAIAIASDGKLYIAIQGGAIMCYDSAGNYLYQYGQPLAAIEGNEPVPLEAGQVGSVQDLAVAPNGDLVVTDYGYGYGRVMQITFSGD